MSTFDMSRVYYMQTEVLMDCPNEGSTDPDCNCDGCDGS